MTNEEFERKMDFLAQHQADLSIKLEKISKEVEKLTKITAKDRRHTIELERSFVLLVDMARRHDERADDTDRLLAEMKADRKARAKYVDEALTKLKELMAKHDHRMASMDARVDRIETRLDE